MPERPVKSNEIPYTNLEISIFQVKGRKWITLNPTSIGHFEYFLTYMRKL